MSASAQCATCNKDERAVKECRIRLYHFQMLRGQKCPREPSTASPSLSQQVEQYQRIPVNKILSAPFQSRLDQTESDIEEVATSIRELGLLEPVIVRPKEKGIFELVAGERRLKACKIAGLTTVPAVVRQLSDQQVFETQVTENIQRRDLTDYEKARILNEMLTRFPEAYPTQEALGKRIGKSQAWIANHLRMLDLEKGNIISREIMEKVTEGQAREILAAPEEKRSEIINRIEQSGEVPSCREIHNTSSVPISPEQTHLPTREPITPKPEPLDVADFTCPECHQNFRISHVAKNRHKLAPFKEEPT